MTASGARITIREIATGMLRHGIKDHIPEGWEKVENKPKPKPQERK